MTLKQAAVPWSALAVSIFLFTWGVKSYTSLEELGGGYVVILFFIPSFATISGLTVSSFRLSMFYSATMLACLLSTMWFWNYYSAANNDEDVLHTCHIWSLAASFALMVLVTYLTVILMMRPRDSRSWWMLVSGEDMKQYGLPTIAVFLGVFMSSAFLLAFALAFHDKKERMTDSLGLYAKIFQVRNHAGSQGARAVPEIESEEPYIFLFAEGEAEIESEFQAGDPRVRSADELEGLCEQSIKDQGLISRYARSYRAANNTSILKKISRQVDQMRPGQKLQMILVGHTNNSSLRENSEKFRSNYELSEARVAAARAFMIHGLSIKGSENIESWTLVALGEQKDFRFSPDVISECGLDERRSVEVFLRPKSIDAGRSLVLLDYIYSIIYTVTTSAYGDIIPVTASAKFISSVANIFELFFSVVFIR